MIHTAFDSLFRLAFKADVPPDWYVDSQRLAALLQGEWDRVSREFLLELKDGIQNKDLSRLGALSDSLKELNFPLSGEATDQLKTLLDGIQNRVIAAYSLHGRNVGLGERIKAFDGDYKKFLTEAHADQIKAFTKANPSRILHPEIERQVAYIRDTEAGRFVDVSLISERLERIVKQEEYWKGLSDVQVSRLWQHDGVKLAEENKIDVLYVSGPDDIRTCPVCKAMLGQRLEVKRVLKRFEDHARITDPDEYVKAWPFPRFEQIDNMSNEERVERTGHMPPPYHPHCRHGVSWLTESIQVQGETLEPQHYPVEIRKFDKLLLKPPTLKDAKREWSESGYWTYHKLETVPIRDISVPAVWNQSRIDSINEAILRKKPLPPVQLSEDPLGGNLKISDGIHRTNASRDAGYSEIPAIVNRIDRQEPTTARLSQIRADNKTTEKALM